MHFTEPEVYCIAETKINRDEVTRMLEDLGAEYDQDTAPSDVEELIEINGRLCYMSFVDKNNPDQYLNPNITKIREGSKRYLNNIKKSGHGSVIEHGVAEFVFNNVSRVFTHELVRHRIGSFSQESLRYVRADDIGMWLPDLFKGNRAIESHFESIAEDSEMRYNHILALATRDELKDHPNHISTVDNPHYCSIKDGCMNDLPFDLKKKITSAARRVLPIGLSTTITWTTNMRNLRHVIEMRTARHSEEEIRLVFAKVAEISIHNWPNLFNDYKITVVDGLPEYTTESNKI